MIDNTWFQSKDKDKDNEVVKMYEKSSYAVFGDTLEHMAALVARSDVSLPRSFDARERWPLCASVHQIHNQAGCGSCFVSFSLLSLDPKIVTYTNFRLFPPPRSWPIEFALAQTAQNSRKSRRVICSIVVRIAARKFESENLRNFTIQNFLRFADATAHFGRFSRLHGLKQTASLAAALIKATRQDSIRTYPSL